MKKYNLLLVFFLLSLISVYSQKKHTLTIIFSGMKSNKGVVFVGLHNEEATFLKERFREGVVNVSNKEAVVIFENLPEGEYAVSAFHDENDNKELDTNFIGIPKEPIGISNDAKGFMGPPKYDDAKFLVSENKEIKIIIN